MKEFGRATACSGAFGVFTQIADQVPDDIRCHIGGFLQIDERDIDVGLPVRVRHRECAFDDLVAAELLDQIDEPLALA